jgi:hypothetical protein
LFVTEIKKRSKAVRKMLIVFMVISNFLLIAAVVLAFTNIDLQFINTSSFVDKILSWLIFLLVMFLSLVVLCLGVYSIIHFWTPGNGFIVMLLTCLCGFLIFALPMEVINKYFDSIRHTPFPVLFYIFFAVFFILDFAIIALFLQGDKKRLPVPVLIKKMFPAITVMIVLSAFITVYGYSAVLYLQAEGIDALAKVFVTIGNVVYFLVFLIAPLVGLVNFYLSDAESQNTAEKPAV